MTTDVDVAIVGGGPAGSTAGTLLKKYAPKLKVSIFERERFPREHVGESQLPPIGLILHEMGCWDKVEAAGFPVKVGGAYRWGTTDDLWNFDFINPSDLESDQRPGRFQGVREKTAFQVDRARYDKILLDHARGLGCSVFEETTVREVAKDGDRITSLKLHDGTEVFARYVIDASGGAGIVRRAMGVETNSPTSLRNIAIWQYWENAEWAVKIGVGGTRVFVMSLGYGWIWFIPLGPTRTSVGLIVPAEYYKNSGERPQALYQKALAEEPLIASLMKQAVPAGDLLTTKDWSFISDRTVGENWFLAGESAGFADPILAAGMTLAHQGAREAAYTILALDEGKEDPTWLRSSYDDLQRKRLWQHIRFADYWYSANAQFTDLKEFTREIARDAGLDLDADAAFQWLGTGGFTTENLGASSLSTYDVVALKKLTSRFSGGSASWAIEGAQSFRLNLDGAQEISVPLYQDGHVERIRCYERDGSRLPLVGVYRAVHRALKWGGNEPSSFHKNLEAARAASYPQADPREFRNAGLQVLEALATEGWVAVEPSVTARHAMNPTVDVAIIGGGPAGSTAGTLLKKYATHLRVAIYERERFPRDHVGESQLPPIGKVLHEMGVWDKVEAAGFPIKVGATYRWGTTDDLWDFDFVDQRAMQSLSRPSPFRGVRTATALQVDRAQFDKILLDHAREMGCDVREETAVREIEREGDRVTALRLGNGEEVRPRYVIDASGGAGVVRRAMGVGTTTPTSLMNIAIWRYWENAEWAVKIGVGGTRVYVMSLGYGWIWFIPLGPTRTSVGLIVPAEYYKKSGERPETLYARAMGEDPLIASLLEDAQAEEGVFATKDWSFLSDRTVGENWFLAGESAGFADPILAAGMTLAHRGAREAAYTILALEEGQESPDWLRAEYDDNQRSRLRMHIRFADYWYSANAQFTDLKEFTREIAQDAGLDLDPDAAFQWLGTGGFTSEFLGGSGVGTFDVRAIRLLTERFGDHMADWRINGTNRFALDLAGAEETSVAEYRDGKVTPYRCYLRDGKRLAVYGIHRGVVESLGEGVDLPTLEANLERFRASTGNSVYAPQQWRALALQSLEALVHEGWVVASCDPSRPTLRLEDAPLPVHPA